MSGYIGRAISAFFKENEDLVAAAKTVGESLRFRSYIREEVTSMATGLHWYRWQVTFETKAEAESFDAAIRRLVDASSPSGEES